MHHSALLQSSMSLKWWIWQAWHGPLGVLEEQSALGNFMGEWKKFLFHVFLAAFPLKISGWWRWRWNRISTHIRTAWVSSCGSGRLFQGIVPEGFSVVTQLCQSSGFSALKRMSLLFPPTLQLWSFLLAVGLAPVGSADVKSKKNISF